MATTTHCRKKRKRKKPKHNHNHPSKLQPTTIKTTGHCKNKISTKPSLVADLTHCRKGGKKRAKPQPSTKNNQPYKIVTQRSNPRTHLSHYRASKSNPQITTTMTHHRSPLKQIKSHKEIEFREREEKEEEKSRRGKSEQRRRKEKKKRKKKSFLKRRREKKL